MSQDPTNPHSKPLSLPFDQTVFLEELRVIFREEITKANRIKALPTLLSTDEVALALKVSIRTVENLIAEGEFRPIFVRRQRRFTSESVHAYLKSQAGKKRRAA